jgi:preprotein translocase subunit SecF
MRIIRETNIDFIRWRWYAIALSTIILTFGLVQMARVGLPLGIDFAGGTIVVVQFERAVGEEEVRRALEPVPGEKVVQQYGDRADHQILIRLPMMEGEEEGAALEEGMQAVMAALREADLGTFDVIATELVGPVIGAELQRKGIYATVAALIGIMLYIALRFRFSFAVGAGIATFHDVIVTLAFLELFGFELSLNVVAALLAITGYSVNDTIVIFDRVRENLRVMRRDRLDAVVNRSVNQTLARTIITSGTTLMAVTALFLFGGEVLRSFAFTMIVGVAAGTYSTVFIAASVAYGLSQRQQAARARAVAAPAAADARPRKQAARPRAS